MRRRALGLVLGLVALAGMAQAAEPVTDYTLDNGLRLVVIEDHRAAAVTHMVWYRVGAADEPAGQSGIAHFLEHMMFKGTDDHPSGAFSKTVAQLGGTDNAFTSWDYTAYFQRVATEHLGLMMAFEADRMADLVFVDQEVATEREVILEERSQRTDSDPGALLREQARAALYLNHPYGIPIIGWRHEQAQLSLDDLRAFYDFHYGPNNAVVVVAGDVLPEEVLALAEQTYGTVPANPLIVPRDRPGEPPQIAERRLRLADPRVADPFVTRSYLAPARKPGDQAQAAALAVLAELLGGNPATSYLGQRLQFDAQVAVYTSAFYDGEALDDGQFSLALVPAEGISLSEAEAALDAALDAFLDAPIDAAALDRVKAQIRAADIYARDAVDRRARRYGSALTSGLTIADVQAWPAAMTAVTAQDVKDAARAVLDRRRSVTAWLERAPKPEVGQ